MSRQQEQHYKERKPEETIAYIREILKELDLSVQEQWVPKSSADTWSMRVTLENTSFGSNGKGVSKVYARASAYAELMERLQNDILKLLTRYPKTGRSFRQTPDEISMTAEEIGASENALVDWFFEARGKKDASQAERAAYIRKNYKIEYFLYGKANSYEARPFYSVKKKKVEYIPHYMYMIHCGSNGMCAGNTPAEALVQGLSEILERHVQEKIFLEKPVLPDVPDGYIQNYPYVWEMLQKLRKLPGLRFALKDCSFGGRYPVAALLVTEENSGQFGIKLGCHPDFGIAMERTITEAAQGVDFQGYAKRSVFDFTNRGVDAVINIYNSYKMGFGAYPYQIFGREPSWEFTPVRDVSQMDNLQILKEMLQELQKDGREILIRDVSFTGFPSFQIIVPGMSDIVRNYGEKDLRVYNTKAYLVPYLNDPKRIDQRIAKLIRGVFDYYSKLQLENQMKNLYCAYPDFDFPGEEIGFGWLYMTAMCCVFLGEYREAADRMRGLVRASEELNGKNTGFYRAAYHYLTARAEGMSAEEIGGYLENLFAPEIAGRVKEIFKKPEEVFLCQYPTFDYLGMDPNGELPQGEYTEWLKIKEKLNNYMEQHPLSQEKIAQYLTDIE